MCDASRLPPDRLVLSITSMVVQLELLDIIQHDIVPYSPRLSTAVCQSHAALDTFWARCTGQEQGLYFLLRSIKNNTTLNG